MKYKFAQLIILGCLLVAVQAPAQEQQQPAAAETAVATFAGGCFWCMEPPFDKLPGVISTTSGYIGCQVVNPPYEQVSAGTTGHAEAVQIIYNPAQVSYRQLLDTFWHNIDPLDAGGQFCDRGDQYRSAVFYHDEEQHKLAEQSKLDLQKSKVLAAASIATKIETAGKFYPAEDYHQDYYRKNPIRYKFYRHGCGRDKVLQERWKEKD
jgi:peptide-methionine (S)-S-oxide reductase